MDSKKDRGNSRNQMQKITELSKWLQESETVSKDHRYYHLLLKGDPTSMVLILPELRQIFYAAHEDARMRYKNLLGVPLDPLPMNGDRDNEIDNFLSNYPSKLEHTTLKGYFGEIFAGIVAEHYSPFGNNEWEVPVFLFRFHQLAFDQLEKWWETGQSPGVIPGRTGDDNLAFLRDGQGNIISTMFCEAKCTDSHDSSLIVDAHLKISDKSLQPTELLRIIEILEDSCDPEAKNWIYGLQNLYHNVKNSKYERYDLVCYVCGQSPKQSNRQTWISQDKPHLSYKANRKLEAVEIHLSDVDELIQMVYEKRVENDPELQR